MAKRSVRWLLVGSCAYGAMTGGMVQAQTTTPTPQTVPDVAEAAEEGTPAAQDVVVTGSRISRPDYVANSPIVSIGQDTFQNTGRVTLERALGELPQFTGAFGAANGGSTSTGLNGGQAYGSLRGLGPKRTLILLDGRRIQPSNPDGSVDLNILPEALLERVEVITGGASTTYGSDATAGVVNFRLRRDFEGLELNGNYGLTDYGDGEQYSITGALGGKFADNRGSAVLAVGYTGRGRAFQSKRPFYSARATTAGTSTLPQGNVLFGSNTPLLSTVNSLFVGKYGTRGFPSTSTTQRYTAQVGFNMDGTLFSNLGVPVLNFRDPQTDLAYIVNTGSAANPASSQQVNFGFLGSTIQADLERYNVFGKVDYALSDSVKIFAEVQYITYDTLGVTNPTLASNVYQLGSPITNPFIPQDLRTILASRSAPAADFILYKAFNALGPRLQGYSYDVYQITSGLSGDLGIRDWTWNAYGSISRTKFSNYQTGGASSASVRTLLYAADGGRSTCAGGLNLFGDFPISDQCTAYISRRTQNTNDLRQRVAEASVQGSLFDWWAGTVRFAAGADYRYNSFAFNPDAAFSQANAFGQTGASDILGYSVLLPTGGSVNTREAFAELLVPLLKDIPLIQELNLDLGYRYSDYNTVGGLHTYKADLDWKVVDTLRLRGGYNRAVRAPSVGELYAPISTASVGIGTASATNTNGDPCDTRSSFRRGGSAAQVRSLCLAQGIPASIIDSYQLGTAQVFALNGGNPDLDEETADTYSAGMVITSPAPSGLFRRMSASFDFYKIRISDAIGPLSIAAGFQNCFNAGGNNPSFNPANEYCLAIGARNPSTGTPVSPSQPLLNLGNFNVEGIDVQFDWSFELADLGLGEIGSLNFNSAVSYLHKFEIQSLPTAPTYDYAGTIGAQGQVETNAGTAHPRWKTVTSGTYSIGPVSLGLKWRFIDRMRAAARVQTPTSVTRGVDAYHVFDFNARVETPFGSELRFGATNLFNKAPPQVGDDFGNYDSQNYDTIGRYFFFGLMQKF